MRFPTFSAFHRYGRAARCLSYPPGFPHFWISFPTRRTVFHYMDCVDLSAVSDFQSLSGITARFLGPHRANSWRIFPVLPTFYIIYKRPIGLSCLFLLPTFDFCNDFRNSNTIAIPSAIEFNFIETFELISILRFLPFIMQLIRNMATFSIIC